MIERKQHPEYYRGCRDALAQYAWSRYGILYVGSGTTTLQQAMNQVNRFEDETMEDWFKDEQIRENKEA